MNDDDRRRELAALRARHDYLLVQHHAVETALRAAVDHIRHTGSSNDLSGLAQTILGLCQQTPNSPANTFALITYESLAQWIREGADPDRFPLAPIRQRTDG